MIELYLTDNRDVYPKIQRLLARRTGADVDIARTVNGKPYAVGNPLFFSLSHSGERAVVALSDSPVGVDLEFYRREPRHPHLLARMTERERTELCGDERKFYRNWVVKEAFIKMRGGTLAHDLKKLEYVGGQLYCDGESTGAVNLCELWDGAAVCAVCTVDGQIFTGGIQEL